AALPAAHLPGAHPDLHPPGPLRPLRPGRRPATVGPAASASPVDIQQPARAGSELTTCTRVSRPQPVASTRDHARHECDALSSSTYIEVGPRPERRAAEEVGMPQRREQRLPRTLRALRTSQTLRTSRPPRAARSKAPTPAAIRAFGAFAAIWAAALA